MTRVEIEIRGTTALLMHRFSEGAEGDLGKTTRRVQMENKDPRQVAEAACYRDGDGNLYFPSSAIFRILREAGGAHKQRGSRKSLKWIVPAAVRMTEEAIPLADAAGQRMCTFEVDSRPVTIPSTRGRVMRHRARLDEWGSRFEILVNESVLAPKTVHQLLVEGGEQIGMGDYRPSCGGPFGTFQVVLWREVGSTVPPAAPRPVPVAD